MIWMKPQVILESFFESLDIKVSSEESTSSTNSTTLINEDLEADLNIQLDLCTSFSNISEKYEPTGRLETSGMASILSELKYGLTTNSTFSVATGSNVTLVDAD